MIFWEILAYLSIGVCYFGAVAVIYGWIKFGMERKKGKMEDE
ncbi:hypothetical protein J18TS1_27060 [Oceanobacillus oncorhynchi subsp. incaldanensis]|nr:hypothetical protein [Oceanobacillus oncorhynchi]GIO19606.1 hypothetical protein J18TS1_27060 [Oceanobacillus oncorhynchi subsp. incaldanensis]